MHLKLLYGLKYFFRLTNLVLRKNNHYNTILPTYRQTQHQLQKFDFNITEKLVAIIEYAKEFFFLEHHDKEQYKLHI